MRDMRIVTVLGTRPEIIKCSPLLPEFDARFAHRLVHTGQHYDEAMDACFFRDLALRPPDVQLTAGSASHATQLARMLTGIEAVLQEFIPDLVFVQGDTNSTLAGALAAAKLGIPVVHLEAGCRSFNRAMPEEINRVVVDHLADLCLAPDEQAVQHLTDEGIAPRCVVLAGSTGIDACLRVSAIPAPPAMDGLPAHPPGSYLVATIHRAENTTPERLHELVGALSDLSEHWPVLFPVHPRTARVLDEVGRPGGVTWLEPLGYPHMMTLLRGARALLTDSGGLQEEAAVLGVPTFILRGETEWQAFVDMGRHALVGTERCEVVAAVMEKLGDHEQERRMRVPAGLERAGATRRVLAALEQHLPEQAKGLATWKALSFASPHPGDGRSRLSAGTLGAPSASGNGTVR
jgi:UDP-N-acetylglucosamine 2-epimerase (non-hydrolysing)